LLRGCGHFLSHTSSNQGQSRVFPLLDFVHVPLPLPHLSRFHEALCFWESHPPFVDINTIFRKGNSILILIFHSMRDLGQHRGKHHCSLLSLAPITFDANTFSCYGGSYFATIAVIYHLSKTSELGRAINAHIIIAAYYRDHCLLFRVCSFAGLSSAFIITAPEGTPVVYTNTSVNFFQSYITRSWGMPASFVHSFLFFAQLSEGRVLPVPFFSNGSL
jgi:hypothetical protein